MNKKLRSKMTTFQTLNTNPMDYTVLYTKAEVLLRKRVDHCELCGAALDYAFPLVHKDSTKVNDKKDLMIGSDCVNNFMETYFPLKKDFIKQKIEEVVTETRISRFLSDNPKALSSAQELWTYLTQTLAQSCRDKELYQEYRSFLNSEFFHQIKTDIRTLNNKKYLSKPKTLKLMKLHKMIKSNGFLSLIKEIQKAHAETIEEAMKKDPEFYNVYIERNFRAYRQSSTNNFLFRPAFSKFEKQNFLVRNKIKTLKIEIVKGVF